MQKKVAVLVPYFKGVYRGAYEMAKEFAQTKPTITVDVDRVAALVKAGTISKVFIIMGAQKSRKVITVQDACEYLKRDCPKLKVITAGIDRTKPLQYVLPDDVDKLRGSF